jgi:hypothetical protein
MADNKLSYSALADFYKKNGKLPTAQDFNADTITPEGTPSPNAEFFNNAVTQIPNLVSAESENENNLGLNDLDNSLNESKLASYIPNLNLDNRLADNSNGVSDSNIPEMQPNIQPTPAASPKIGNELKQIAAQEAAHTSPEKQAQLANSKDIATNPLRDQEMENALQASNQNTTTANLLKVFGNLISGAGTYGAGKQVDIDTSMADQLGRQANSPVEQLALARKQQQEKMTLDSEAESRKPDSEISRAYREFAKRMGANVPENATAAQLKVLTPLYEKAKAFEQASEDRKLKYAELASNRQAAGQTKMSAADEKTRDKIAKSVNGLMATSRSVMGQQLALANRGVHAMNMLNSESDPSKLSAAAISEGYVALASMIKGSALTESDKHELIQNPLSAQASRIMTNITGEPMPANAPGIVNFLKHSLNRQIETSRKLVEPQFNLVEKANKNWIANHPEDWQELKQAGLETVGLGQTNQMANTAEVTDEDKQAIEWAKSNPKDPRAEQILKLHGVK